MLEGSFGGPLIMRIVIVDDTDLYRLMLAETLAAEASFDAVETAADAEAALGVLTGASSGAVVLLNMRMHGSAMVLNSIVQARPATPVIAMAVSDREDDIVACVEAGVAGCLLRDEPYADLIALVLSVARGETRCSPRVGAALVRRLATLSRGSRVHPTEPWLTTREREVIQLVNEGLSNKQIARRLSIELRTVKNHVQHILAKYQVHRRADAAALFRAIGRGDHRTSQVATDARLSSLS